MITHQENLETHPMSDIISTSNSDPITALLVRAATDTNFDAGKFEVAVNFLREREATQARRAFNDAMASAQAEMRAIHRDAKNDHLRSRYATLDGMLSTILPAATRHGLNVRFGSAPATQPGWQCVTCIVSLGDHVEITSLEGPVVVAGAAGGRTQMTGIQATGSTTTYLKRYLLGMVFSLVLTDEQDDDGEAGRRRWTAPPSRPPVAEIEQPKRPTVTQWLDALASELAACEGGEEVDAILARDDVQQAQDKLRNGAADRLNHMIHAAIARTAATETSAPEDDGLYAPGEDPFREPAAAG
jgi:hypothetical protein